MEAIVKDFRKVMYTLIFKMVNQQGPFFIAHGTQLNVMCQPGWEGALGGEWIH